MLFILLVVVLFFIGKEISTLANTKKVKSIQDEQRRQREAIVAEYVERQRIAEKVAILEAEQSRQAAAQKKQAEQLAKHEEEIEKLSFNIDQAESEIAHLRRQIEEYNEHGKYLELERDACAYGSTNYYKWNSKVLANNEKVFSLAKRLSKAEYTKATAKKRLAA